MNTIGPKVLEQEVQEEVKNPSKICDVEVEDEANDLTLQSPTRRNNE